MVDKRVAGLDIFVNSAGVAHRERRNLLQP